MSDSRWIPLESNPEVLNKWISKAGVVTSQDEFGDIYGLDPELLAMVPRPVKAVILLFPRSAEFQQKQEAQDKKRREEGGHTSIDPTVFWMKQTIGNACGTMAVLHALTNSDVTFVPESPMAKFLEEAKDKTPLDRAILLEKTTLFANIHAEMASSGQTAVPQDLDTDLHFTCFVQAPTAASRQAGIGTGEMHVIELDGTREGPINHGSVKRDEDFLGTVSRVVKSEFIDKSTSLHFNLMYLGAPPN